MRHTRSWHWALTALLLATGTMLARADQAVNLPFDSSSGRLTFSRVATATVYRVEWAPSPAGPWTNFTRAAEQLDAIAQFATGSYTCTVPTCYRLVATVTNAQPNAPTSDMVLIPAGSFSMGDSLDGYSDALPVHTVYVSAFYMDKHEVIKNTWDEVAAWAATNGYDLTTGGAAGKASGHPAQGMNWFSAVKWCNARSQKEGLTPCYTTVTGTVYKSGTSALECNWMADGYRLPTEAEWEKAARGGLSGKRFPWGDTINHSFANYAANSSKFTYDTSGYAIYTFHPAYDEGGTPYTNPVWAWGYTANNGYGLYDMAGNVCEWCWDWYGVAYYGGSPGSDPRGPPSGSARVARGGSWYTSAYECRVACRSTDYQWNGYQDVGFRPVRRVP